MYVHVWPSRDILPFKEEPLPGLRQYRSRSCSAAQTHLLALLYPFSSNTSPYSAASIPDRLDTYIMHTYMQTCLRRICVYMHIHT